MRPSIQLNDRAEKVMKFLLRTGTASIEEILAEAGSSAPSIRRDLVLLENRGLIRRTHGGATLVEPLLYEPFRYDRSFQAREQRFVNEKRRIGLAAAELILDHETIGLNAGTTATLVGRSLRHRNHLKVVTNAVNIAMELCNQPGITTCLTGGEVSWEWSFSLTGASALNFLNDVYMDRVFLSVIGLDIARGATTLETDEALVFRKMIKQAKQVIVVADSSKLGKVGAAYICPTSDVHLLITDTGASDGNVAQLSAGGMQVLRV
jgi:DeoR family transcriptional regulator of aga operon